MVVPEVTARVVYRCSAREYTVIEQAALRLSIELSECRQFLELGLVDHLSQRMAKE